MYGNTTFRRLCCCGNLQLTLDTEGICSWWCVQKLFSGWLKELYSHWPKHWQSSWSNVRGLIQECLAVVRVCFFGATTLQGCQPPGSLGNLISVMPSTWNGTLAMLRKSKDADGLRMIGASMQGRRPWINGCPYVLMYVLMQCNGLQLNM